VDGIEEQSELDARVDRVSHSRGHHLLDSAVCVVDSPTRDPALAGSASRTRSASPAIRATETLTKFILVDMFAKSIQGMRPEDAVAWATGEIRKIYGA
jgi:hypothetical protein